LDPTGLARDAIDCLLVAFTGNVLTFVDSGWLDTELRQTEPESSRNMLLRSVPNGHWVQWDAALRRDAVRWAIGLGLQGDDSGEADCRHLACALRGDAGVLVTHDGRFYEAMRQHAKLLVPLRPAKLIGWQEYVLEHQAEEQ
jgi:hypothetical protein